MNALYDVVAPITGCIIAIWFRSWRVERRARERAELQGRSQEEMPVVGASSTTDSPRN